MRDRLTLGAALTITLALFPAAASRVEAQEPPGIGHQTPTESMIERRSGWYFGLAGGVTVPMGSTGDGYDTGWNFRVPIGWQRPGAALGLQLDLQYDDLPSKGNVTHALKQWSGMLDAIARFPVGPSGKSGLYVLGGPGLNLVQDLPRPNAETSGINYENRWCFGVNGGLGAGLGVGRHGELFVEGRYTYVWVPDGAVHFLPVTGGVKLVF